MSAFFAVLAAVLTTSCLALASVMATTTSNVAAFLVVLAALSAALCRVNFRYGALLAGITWIGSTAVSSNALVSFLAVLPLVALLAIFSYRSFSARRQLSLRMAPHEVGPSLAMTRQALLARLGPNPDLPRDLAVLRVHHPPAVPRTVLRLLSRTGPEVLVAQWEEDMLLVVDTPSSSRARRAAMEVVESSPGLLSGAWTSWPSQPLAQWVHLCAGKVPSPGSPTAWARA